MIRWGIIGVGDVCEVKSGPAFQKAVGSALVAVMRRSEEKAQDFAVRHGVPYAFGDADRVIHHAEVDAVYIATPPSSHHDYALRVAAARKPCYIEKPMARNTTECAAIQEAFAEAGVPVWVAFYRRALPRFIQAKELLDSGRLGMVTGVTYRYASPSHTRTDAENLPWRVLAAEAGGGLFLDLGCHTLDVLDFLLGALTEVSGDAAHLAAPYDVEDAVAMRFRLTNGAFGTATWNFASALRDDTIEISGTAGRLRFSTFGNEPLLLETETGTETFDLPNPPHVHQPLVQTIVDELHGTGHCPSTAVTAMRTAAVMDTVLSRYYNGRVDAFWERPTAWNR